jgi:hypothetical protein
MSENAADSGLPAREFGWWDVFVPPDADPREEGDVPVGERATLVRYLRNRRLTLELKCAGLTPEQMARRAVPPSNLSLLGLVRHLAGVEHFWFRQVMAGRDGPRLYRREGEPGLDFDGAEPDAAVVAESWSTWLAEVAFAERLVAQTADLGQEGTFDDGVNGPLREVMVHLIEEYARHLGHADFLRERVDGRVGQ